MQELNTLCCEKSKKTPKKVRLNYRLYLQPVSIELLLHGIYKGKLANISKANQRMNQTHDQMYSGAVLQQRRANRKIVDAILAHAPNWRADLHNLHEQPVIDLTSV